VIWTFVGNYHHPGLTIEPRLHGRALEFDFASCFFAGSQGADVPKLAFLVYHQMFSSSSILPNILWVFFINFLSFDLCEAVNSNSALTRYNTYLLVERFKLCTYPMQEQRLYQLTLG
jgi:hypothetical protein